MKYEWKMSKLTNAQNAAAVEKLVAKRYLKSPAKA